MIESGLLRGERARADEGGLRVPARWLILPAALLLMAVLLMAVLLMPLAFAGPARLTSDESLYLAEAYNIADGRGFTYPSGEAIVHRAPLYPAMLAPAVAVGGAESAYVVTKLVVMLNVLLVAALAWRLGGQVAAVVAGLAAGASAYLSELGTTLYLDPTQCAFMLLTLLSLHVGIERRQARWWFVAGLLAGLAFLVKESAVQWAPLGLVVALALPSQRTSAGARGAAGYTGGFAVTIAPWWVWVYAHTGELFLLGEPTAGKSIFVSAAAVGSLAAVVLWWRVPGVRKPQGACIALIAAWGAFLLYGLTAFSGYPAPNEYHSTVPRYLLEVAPQMQPFFPIVAAWLWVVWRAWEGDEGARLVAVAAALAAPFALFAANRWLQLRDALPLVYLSYVVLGLAARDLWQSLKPRLSGGGAAAAASLCAAVAAALFVHQAMAFDRAQAQEAEAREVAGSWDSPYTRDVAAWMEAKIPEGSRVMTSRQYFSSLHVETEGRYLIRQLPTVRVDIDPAQTPMVQARHNLFRWEDAELRPTLADDTWLHLQQFPEKGYWVGLSEQELLAFIAAQRIEYVVLTGDDIAFSSSAYAWYFTANPGFNLMGSFAGTGGDRMFAYKVDAVALALLSHPTTIHPRSAGALEGETGLSIAGLSARLGTTLHVTDLDGGLSEREIAAALEGVSPAKE